VREEKAGGKLKGGYVTDKAAECPKETKQPSLGMLCPTQPDSAQAMDMQDMQDYDAAPAWGPRIGRRDEAHCAVDRVSNAT